MKKQTIFMLTGIIILGLIVVVATKKSEAPNAEVPAPAASEQTPTRITVIYNSQTPFTPATYRVTEGSTAVITVTSDIADELHFHGYDLHTDLTQNIPGTITFTATKTGRFEFELENAKKTLGYVEVYPQ